MMFVQFCDTVRIENNNKFILVGVYSEFMNVQGNEFKGSIEGFLTVTDAPGEFSLKLQYSLLSGEVLESYELRAEAGSDKLTMAQIPLPPVDIALNNNDSLILSAAMNGGDFFEVGRLNINLNSPVNTTEQLSN